MNKNNNNIRSVAWVEARMTTNFYFEQTAKDNQFRVYVKVIQ